MSIPEFYYPAEIAETICNLAYDTPSQEKIDACTEAIYDLMAIAQNEYNKDYFRTMYEVLEALTSAHGDD